MRQFLFSTVTKCCSLWKLLSFSIILMALTLQCRVPRDKVCYDLQLYKWNWIELQTLVLCFVNITRTNANKVWEEFSLCSIDSFGYGDLCHFNCHIISPVFIPPFKVENVSSSSEVWIQVCVDQILWKTIQSSATFLISKFERTWTSLVTC